MSDDDTKVPLPDLENGGDVQVVAGRRHARAFRQ